MANIITSTSTFSYSSTDSSPNAITSFLNSQNINDVIGYTINENDFNNLIYDYNSYSDDIQILATTIYVIRQSDIDNYNAKKFKQKILQDTANANEIANLLAAAMPTNSITFSDTPPTELDGVNGDIWIVRH